MTFHYKDRLFDFWTKNADSSFYYKIHKPTETWGNYTCKIAFFDKNNTLIYHRADYFAHQLEPLPIGNFVKWADGGRKALFYEFKHGPIDRGGIRDLVLIDFVSKTHKRKNLVTQTDSSFICECLRLADRNDTATLHSKFNVDSHENYLDRPAESKLRALFGKTRWLPR